MLYILCLITVNWVYSDNILLLFLCVSISNSSRISKARSAQRIALVALVSWFASSSSRARSPSRPSSVVGADRRLPHNTWSPNPSPPTWAAISATAAALVALLAALVVAVVCTACRVARLGQVNPWICSRIISIVSRLSSMSSNKYSNIFSNSSNS